MNEIKLSKMEQRNFKGTVHHILDLGQGMNVNIFGDNGTGKTTANDAFLWVLFDKDSTNRKDFSVKPQDKDGNDRHYVETEVTLELLINGQPKTLRKMLEEVWTKKRGEAEKEFTGHQTSYWVDTVPVKKKEYTDQINAIIDENAFKLLTNPFYFCTQLKWEDRRKTLMEICGDVSDADVIDSVVTVADKSMLDLLNIINTGRTISDHKKIITEKIKMLNKQIEAIPIRISEQSRKITADEQEVNYAVVEEKILEHKATLRTIERSMMGASHLASLYKEKLQESFQLNTAIDERKKELDAENMAGLNKAIDEKSKLAGEQYRLNSDIKSTEVRVRDKRKLITENEADLVKLRDAWNKENEKQFIEPDQNDFVCPTCEQSLPQGKKDLKIAQMSKNFEQNKAQDLANISSGGKQIGANQVNLKDELDALNNDLMNHGMNLSTVTERLLELDKELQAEKARTYGANYDTDPAYSNLQLQLQGIKDELNKPITDTTSELLQRKNKATEQINSLNKLLNNRDVAIKTKERIDELKDEERTLSAQLSQFEKQRYLIEQFIKAKVNLLEGNINSKFEMVKWRLFETQINGGISECCEAMVDGVGWPDVNHAGKVNAGLDIINVLADHYGCVAPIFIDFRESVSRIIETGSQVINLIKSEPDKTLRIEVI